MIVLVHAVALARLNRALRDNQRCQRRANTVFTVWHGMGLATVVLLGFALRRHDSGLKWPLILFVVNQASSIVWWAQATKRCRIADSSGAATDDDTSTP